MRYFISSVIMALALVTSATVSAESTKLIHYSGETIEEPHWFKDSFLELADDIEEAKEEGKQLIVYFHQAGCPYCFNLIQQSLLDPTLSQYIQQHFDLVALNLWGDREVTLPDGSQFSEKALAIHWKVQYTPTLIFFAADGSQKLRIDGYRNPGTMAKILEFVATGGEGNLAQTLVTADATKSLYPSQRIHTTDNLTNLTSDKPVFVMFEYPGCEDCDQFHRQVIQRKDSDNNLSEYQAYRVDVTSEKLITTPDGTKLKAADWAQALGLSYFPSVLLFDQQKQEQFRIDAYVQAFHFNAALEYVSRKKYIEMSEFQRYINERADKLRAEGKKVVITQ